MSHFIVRIWLLILAFALQPALAQPVVLKEGTPLLLTTVDRLVSGEVPAGSVVRYKVDRDVLGPQGQVLIARGADARGKVLKSEGSGFFGRSGALDISLETVVAADGTSVPLRAVRAATAADQETAVIVGGILLSWAFIFMEGDDIDIPAGTPLDAFVDLDTPVAKPGARVKLLPCSVKILTPASGSHLKEEEKIFFSCEATPKDEEPWVRVYIDQILVASQRGNLSNVLWNTYRNEKQTERVTGPGEHQVVLEVTWSNGQIATSEPIKLTFKDGPW
ncbi:MAG: hypothetical protein AMXMBFR33_68740 [Candidatus Xenobia bacterium]